MNANEFLLRKRGQRIFLIKWINLKSMKFSNSSCVCYEGIKDENRQCWLIVQVFNVLMIVARRCIPLI